MKIKLNPKIESLLAYLDENNIEVYLVGGYIRDFLISKECFDLDFSLVSGYDDAINALKKKYKINCNDEYSCIKFKIDEYDIEITHARKEKEYLDFRHPSYIEYTDDIKEDYERRDFTINAIYYRNEEIFDFCNGVDDLKNKRLKVIGDTLTRFKEDPLRILRMIRFSCDNFDISENDKRIILDNAYLLKELSLDSFNKEFDKILMINNLYVINEYKEIFENYFDIKFNNLIVLNRLSELDQKKTYLNIKNKSNLYKYKDIPLTNSELEINKLIYKYGKEIIKGLIIYYDSINETSLIEKYDNIINNKYYCKNDLSISSLEIIQVTNKQELTSYYIDEISYEIMKGNLNNNKEEIIKYLKGRI